MSPDDRATVHLVQNACTDTGCRLFFVNVEHVIEGRACMSYYGNYGLHKQLMKGYDEGEGSVKITGLDGSVLADYDVYGSDGEGLGFLGDDWFDREPDTDPDEDDDDDMEEEDWVRKTYRDTAILIIPDNKLATFIMKHLPEDVAGRADLIERAFSTWQADKQEAWFGHWLRLCEAALENISKPDEVESKAAISTIIDTAITADHSGCQEILLRALKLSNLNAQNLEPEDYENLAAATCRLGIDTMGDVLDGVFAAFEDLSDLYDHLQTFLRHYARIYKIEVDTEAEQPQSPANSAIVTTKTSPEQVSDWSQAALLRAVKTNDFQAISSVAGLRTVLEASEGRRKDEIIEACIESVKRPSVSITTIHQLLRIPACGSSGSMLSLTFDTLLEKIQTQNITADTLIGIVEDIGNHSLAMLRQLVFTIAASRYLHCAKGISSTWLHHLSALAMLAVRKPAFRQLLNTLITTVLAVYLVIEVGAQPQPLLNFAWPMVSCPDNCNQCADLNSHLCDGHEMQFTREYGLVTHRTHAMERLKSIPQQEQILEYDCRKQKGVHTLRVRKIDKRYAVAFSAWKGKEGVYHGTLIQILSTQLRPTDDTVFGSLRLALLNGDVVATGMFLRTTLGLSSSGLSFGFDDQIDTTAKETMLSTIRQRGGELRPNGVNALSQESPGQRRAVHIVPGPQRMLCEKDDDIAAQVKAGVPDQVTIKEAEFDSFLEKCWAEDIDRCLAMPDSAGCLPELSTKPDAAIAQKRKADEMAGGPLMDFGNKVGPPVDDFVPGLAAAEEWSKRHKVSADESDKENVAVVDLT